MAVTLALCGAHILLMQYIVCIFTETVEWSFGTGLKKKDMSLYAERICRLSLSPRVSKLNPLAQSLSKQVESVDSEGEVLGGSVLLFMAAAHSLGKLRLVTCLRGSTGGAPVTTVAFPQV